MNEEHEEHVTEPAERRDRIVEAILPHAALDGWNERALINAVADAGLARDEAFRAFPNGIAEVIQHFSAMSDQKMIEALHEADVEAMRMRDRIVFAIRSRLEANLRYKEAVRRALSFLALPQNAGVGLRNTYRTVDAIWYAVGDTSTDFSFYTRRALLASIYVATVLYWLDDESEENAETWSFLDRRIDDVMALPRAGARLKRATAPFTAPFERLARSIFRERRSYS